MVSCVGVEVVLVALQDRVGHARVCAGQATKTNLQLACPPVGHYVCLYGEGVISGGQQQQ